MWICSSNWIISTQISRDEKIPTKYVSCHHVGKKICEKIHGKVTLDFLQTSNIQKKNHPYEIHLTKPINCFTESPPGLQWPATLGKQGYQCLSPWLEIDLDDTPTLSTMGFLEIGNPSLNDHPIHFWRKCLFDILPKTKKMGAFLMIPEINLDIG